MSEFEAITDNEMEEIRMLEREIRKLEIENRRIVEETRLIRRKAKRLIWRKEKIWKKLLKHGVYIGVLRKVECKEYE